MACLGDNTQRQLTWGAFFSSVDLMLLWKTGYQRYEHVGSSNLPDTMIDSSFIHSIPPNSLSPNPPPPDLRNQPYRRADAVRRSVRRRFDDQNLRTVNNGEVVMWWGNGARADKWGWGVWGWWWGCEERGQKVGCRTKDDKWKMTGDVATIEMTMYVYIYIT